MSKALKRWRVLVESSVHSEGHLERVAESFAGENGLLVRTVPWGEFNTLAMMTRDGPIWFPIGNLSHISTHTDYGEIDEETGEAKKTSYGVVHMNNGSMYITDATFDEDRQLAVTTRMAAFENFSRVVNKESVEE